jgi:bifunctional enzyme CysN/CysC/sulfate adenylyltransferase subunit 1
LEDEIDLSRGEMLVSAGNGPGTLPHIANRFVAMVVWMHNDPLAVGKSYFAKHSTRTVRATVRRLHYRVDINTLQEIKTGSLGLNEIGEVEFETNLPLFFDPYSVSRTTGSLILIDAISNATVGAAMIVSDVTDETTSPEKPPRPSSLIAVPGRVALAHTLRDAILARGQSAVVVDDPLIEESSLAGVVRALELANVVAITSRSLTHQTLLAIRDVAESEVRVLHQSDRELIREAEAGEI